MVDWHRGIMKGKRNGDKMSSVLRSKPVKWSTLPYTTYQYIGMEPYQVPKHIRHSESMVEGIYASAARRAEINLFLWERYVNDLNIEPLTMADTEYLNRKAQLLSNPILQNLNTTVKMNQLFMVTAFHGNQT